MRTLGTVVWLGVLDGWPQAPSAKQLAVIASDNNSMCRQIITIRSRMLAKHN